LRAFAEVVGPVFLALVLTVATHPLTGLLHRMGVPRWLAVSLTLVGVFGIVFGLAAALTLSVAQLTTLLPAYENP
jgi:predicted PurR-regulated permease PerM